MIRKLPVVLLLSSLYCSFHENPIQTTNNESKQEIMNRNKRDFHNTINKIPEMILHEMIHQRNFILQKEMCSLIPCQRMPFLVSYQVS